MEFKGTKGKWKVFRPEVSNGFYYVQVGNGITSNNTATCHNPFTLSTDFGDDSETKANAHLIAAAPELLEALINVERLYSDIERLVDGEVKDMLDQTRKAINKALNK